MDEPNDRSLHHRPTPRGGGLAVLLAALITLGCALPVSAMGRDQLMLLGATLIIGAVSYWDDLRNLAPLSRLSVQVGSALLAVLAGACLQEFRIPGHAWPLPAAAAGVLSALVLIWMTNLYNFMDGMDGLCGGMTVFGFAGMAALGAVQGAAGFALLCAIIAAAAGGFLWHNVPPARIFMGDVGSSTLGFVAATCGLWADREGLFPLWIWALLFSPFIVDATYTLARRLAARERIWEAHRSHCYQQLVAIQGSHARTLRVEYTIMLGCLITAVALLRAAPAAQVAALVAWVAAYAAGIAAIRSRMRRQGG